MQKCREGQEKLVKNADCFEWVVELKKVIKEHKRFLKKKRSLLLFPFSLTLLLLLAMRLRAGPAYSSVAARRGE